MNEPVILRPYLPELDAFYELWKLLKKDNYQNSIKFHEEMCRYMIFLRFSRACHMSVIFLKKSYFMIISDNWWLFFLFDYYGYPVYQTSKDHFWISILKWWKIQISCDYHRIWVWPRNPDCEGWQRNDIFFGLICANKTFLACSH